MKRLLALLLALLSTLAAAQQKPLPDFHRFLLDTALPATYALYRQQADGGFVHQCSVVAFENRTAANGKDNLVRFQSASHCVERNPSDNDKAVSTAYYVTQDVDSNVETFLKVRLLFFGKLSTGEDFAVFEAKTKAPVTILALGEDPKEPDTPVTEVGNAFSLGRQVLHGSVSRASFDRIAGPPGGNWEGYIMLQLSGSGPGSSGAPIICNDQHAICGFLSGSDGDAHFASPVSRFKAWYQSAQSPDEMKQLIQKLRDQLDRAQSVPVVPPPPKGWKAQKIGKK